MKTLKVLLLILLFVFTINTLVINAQVQPDIKIIMVDKNLNFEYLDCDVSPIIENNYTLVPLRAIAENLGFTVDWDESKQSIRLSKESSNLLLTIGSKLAIANLKNVTMPISPLIINNRTLIPLRFVSEFFNKKVIWHEGQKIDPQWSNFYTEEEKKNLEANYIWISDYDLLNNEDVNVLNNKNYYFCENDSAQYYRLNDNGITTRGIKIGDDYKKVIEVYGEAHEKKVINNKIISVTYITPGIPKTGSVSSLVFNFKDNKVISVIIYPPV